MTGHQPVAAQAHQYYALVQHVGGTEHTLAVIRTRAAAPDEIWLRCGDSGGWHAMRTGIPDRAAPLRLRLGKPEDHPDGGTTLIAPPADPSPPASASIPPAARMRRATRPRRGPRTGANRYVQLEISVTTEHPPPPPIPPPPPTINPPGESSRRLFSLR